MKKNPRSRIAHWFGGKNWQILNWFLDRFLSVLNYTRNIKEFFPLLEEHFLQTKVWIETFLAIELVGFSGKNLFSPISTAGIFSSQSCFYGFYSCLKHPVWSVYFLPLISKQFSDVKIISQREKFNLLQICLIPHPQRIIYDRGQFSNQHFLHHRELLSKNTENNYWWPLVGSHANIKIQIMWKAFFILQSTGRTFIFATFIHWFFS